MTTPKAVVVNIRNEPYDVYIGRPSKYGNRFGIGVNLWSREDVINLYRDWIVKNPKLIDEAKIELKGKRLGCYCAPLPCHGDILAELVNADGDYNGS